MNYIIEVLIIIVCIAIWQLIMFFLRKNFNKGLEQGQINVISHIFTQLKSSGKIDITLNGEKKTMIELIEKKK